MDIEQTPDGTVFVEAQKVDDVPVATVEDFIIALENLPQDYAIVFRDQNGAMCGFLETQDHKNKTVIFQVIAAPAMEGNTL